MHKEISEGKRQQLLLDKHICPKEADSCPKEAAVCRGPLVPCWAQIGFVRLQKRHWMQKFGSRDYDTSTLSWFVHIDCQHVFENV